MEENKELWLHRFDWGLERPKEVVHCEVGPLEVGVCLVFKSRWNLGFKGYPGELN